VVQYVGMAGLPLRLFNTLGREPQRFVPLEAGRAHVYTCGPTVYAYQHVGNLRAYVFADTLRRVLEWKGYEVTHVINITDVGHLTSDMDEGEDKLELASREEARSVWDLAAHYTGAFLDDVTKLRVLPPAAWAKATDHIHEMVEFARVLSSSRVCLRRRATPTRSRRACTSTPRRFATTESSRSWI
jgi:cysteinyl-tRNA synthetase